MHIYDKNFNYITETDDTSVYNNEEYIITDELLANPVKDGNKIREATKQELIEKGVEIALDEGEKIVNKKLIKIERPSQYHKWENGDWTVNLEEVKAQKREELKVIRDKKISEDLEVDGALYQVRAEDLQKFFLKKVEHDLMPDSNKKEVWRLADNTYKEITFEDIKTILSVYGQRQRDIFYKFGVLEAQVNACQSVEEIEAIQRL